MLRGVGWERGDTRSDGAMAWIGEAQGEHLLVVADERGSVLRVYGSPEPLSGWASAAFATDSLLVRLAELYPSEPLQLSKVEVADLARSTIYEVDGLTLPRRVYRGEEGPPSDYYYFEAARPAPP